MKNLVNDKGLIVGLIMGLIGGIMGNLFVTSLYRLIDNKSNGYDLATVIVGLIAYIIIVGLLLRALKK